MIDFQEVLRRAFKYIIEGLAVGLACWLTAPKLSIDEIVIIAVTAAATFAILDMYTPQVSTAARLGTGFGIGSKFAGIRV
jgi:hypothetical protein